MDHQTVYFLIAAVVIFSVYDLWTLMVHGAPTTISEVLLHLAVRTPAVPFAFGLLMGHLFFPLCLK